MRKKSDLDVKKEKLTPAQQEYLKAIYFITRKRSMARTKHIAEFLTVSNAAVSGTLRSLADKGYISYSPYEMITLTRKGLVASRSCLHRQRALYEFFSVVLDMDAAESYDTAKKMEHAVNKKLEERLLNFVHSYRTNNLQSTEQNISCTGVIRCEQCKSQIERIP